MEQWKKNVKKTERLITVRRTKNTNMSKISPIYSGKHIVSGLRLIFSSNKSFLFRNKMMEVSTNHLLLQIESKSFIDSTIRFISSSSASTRSYPEKEAILYSTVYLLSYTDLQIKSKAIGKNTVRKRKIKPLCFIYSHRILQSNRKLNNFRIHIGCYTGTIRP